MKNRTKLIIAGSAVAVLLAVNYAPAVAGDETLLSQLYDMVIEQETRLDNIETELASLKATPTESVPTVEPTDEPFVYNYHSMTIIVEVNGQLKAPSFSAPTYDELMSLIERKGYDITSIIDSAYVHVTSAEAQQEYEDAMAALLRKHGII